MENQTKNHKSIEGNPPWITEGAAFPHGTLFRVKFRGFYHTGKVQSGALVIQGRRFLSPSAAITSITRKHSLDGWLFWECKLSEESPWIEISRLKRGNDFNDIVQH